jgi:hypothetical protein
MGAAVPGASGEVMLAAAALTSDEALFAAGLSAPLEDSEEGRITELYRHVSAALESPPSLIFVIHPNLINFAGDRVAAVLDRLSGGTPLFGAVALDEAVGSRSPLIIHNGAAYSDRVSLLLVSAGKSRFYAESLPATETRSRPAIVTGAQGNRLISVDNIPAAVFMEKAGIISGGKLNAVCAFPLLIDNYDGEGPKLCAIHGIEGNILRCGSTVTTGAALKIGNPGKDDVSRSMTRLTDSIKKENSRSGHLVFSCYGRIMPLVDMKDEMEAFQKQMEGLSYLFVSVGGEFCPVYDREGRALNRFHQYSIISAGF